MPTRLEILYANTVLNELAMEFRDRATRCSHTCGMYKVEGDYHMAEIYENISDAYHTAANKTRARMED